MGRLRRKAFEERGNSIVEMMIIIFIVSIISVSIVLLMTSLFNSASIAGQSLNQRSDIQVTEGFFGSYLSTATSGDIGRIHGAGNDTTASAFLSGDQIVYYNASTGDCYRVFYLGATHELRASVAQAMGSDAASSGTTPPPAGNYTAGYPNGTTGFCASIAPASTNGSQATVTCGPSEYGKAACASDPILDNSTDLNNRSFVLAHNVWPPNNCNGAPYTYGNTQVPAQPCSMFLFYNNPDQDQTPIPFNSANNNAGPTTSATANSSDTWYTGGDMKNISAVGINAVLKGNSTAPTASSLIFTRTFFLGQRSGSDTATVTPGAKHARLATTRPLNATYDNTAGTLTSTVAGAGVLGQIDEVSPAVGDQILVRYQGGRDASGNVVPSIQNGLYTILSLGTNASGGQPATPWKMIRSDGADSDSNWIAGELITVGDGDRQAGSIYQTNITDPSGVVGIKLGQTQFNFSSQSAPNDTPVGSLAAFANSAGGSGNGTLPPGYLLANGQAVSRTQYAELFSVLGTQYGAGNGSTTFNLPNLVGRFPVGWRGQDSHQGGPLWSYNLPGQASGNSAIGLNINQIPPIAFSFSGSAGTGDSIVSTANVNWNKTNTNCYQSCQNGGLFAGADPNGTATYVGEGSGSGWFSGVTNVIGAGQAFSIENPFIALNWGVRY